MRVNDWGVVAFACILAAIAASPIAPSPASALPVAAVPQFGNVTSPAPDMPPEIIGAWQLQVEGRTFKLKNDYNIEMKFNNGRDGLPEALVAYFAGDPRRPSSLCRSQLDLVSRSGGSLVFTETLNYRSDRSAKCPIWGEISMDVSDTGIDLAWHDAGKRKPRVRMRASASRLSGGQECRSVGGSSTGAEVWCRDSEGNWAPQRG